MSDLENKEISKEKIFYGLKEIFLDHYNKQTKYLIEIIDVNIQNWFDKIYEAIYNVVSGEVKNNIYSSYALKSRHRIYVSRFINLTRFSSVIIDEQTLPVYEGDYFCAIKYNEKAYSYLIDKLNEKLECLELRIFNDYIDIDLLFYKKGE